MTDDPRGVARFLFDEHVSYPAFRQLLEDGVDVEHVALIRHRDGGLDDDVAVMEHAMSKGRIVVTRNYRDFAPIVERFAAESRSHPGVLFIPSSLSGSDVGGHIRAVVAWSEDLTDGKRRVADSFGRLTG